MCITYVCGVRKVFANIGGLDLRPHKDKPKPSALNPPPPAFNRMPYRLGIATITPILVRLMEALSLPGGLN